MITPRVPPIDEPRDFAPHELFFSLTDDAGRIRYGNEVFTRVSAYEEEELIGQPHNLIRHPDVPRCVFRLLWDYLHAGKTIAAYVKNLAADGRYYWVLATVTPCRDGYLSIRSHPSSELFDAARAAYAETLKLETQLEAEHGKQHAIERSLPHLTGLIEAAGFQGYDHFMRAALRAELEARAPEAERVGLAHHAAEGCLGGLCDSFAGVGEKLAVVFRSLEVFESLAERLLDKQRALQELGPSLTFLALNTHISASRLGDQGAVLSVVSRNLGESSKAADRLIERLMQKIQPVCDSAQAIAFDVEVAQLEAEVCQAFSVELMQQGATTHDELTTQSTSVLVDELSSRCRQALGSLRELDSNLTAMRSSGQGLLGQVDQMHAAQRNGKIDIAGRPEARRFAAIFDDIEAIVREARRDCHEITDVLDTTATRLESLLTLEPLLNAELTAAEAATASL